MKSGIYLGELEKALFIYPELNGDIEKLRFETSTLNVKKAVMQVKIVGYIHNQMS